MYYPGKGSSHKHAGFSPAVSLGFSFHSSLIIFTVSKPAAHIAAKLAVFLLKTTAIQPADAQLSHMMIFTHHHHHNTELNMRLGSNNTLECELSICNIRHSRDPEPQNQS